jgi:hypothetical protein
MRSPLTFSFSTDGTRSAKDVELPEILTQNDMLILADEYGIALCGVEDMRDSIMQSRLPGWWIQKNYPEGADILLRHTNALAYQYTIDMEQAKTHPAAA